MPMHENTAEAIALRLLKRSYKDLRAAEAQVVTMLSKRQAIARDTNAEFAGTLSLGDRVADRVANFGGSWYFIGLFSAFILGWIALNSLLLYRHGLAFDLYPYIMLNLMLSMVAAMQAPVILMSQNRQSERDRLNAAHDYEINLKAELEILSLHEKIDALRNEQWMELVGIQQEQIRMLMQIMQANGLSTPVADPPNNTRPAAQE